MPMAKTSLGPAATCAVYHSLFQLKSQPKLGLFYIETSSLAFATLCTFPKVHSCCSMHLEVHKPSPKISHSPLMEDVSVHQLKKLNVSSEKSRDHILHDIDGNPQIEDRSYSLHANTKELERRRKIGLANRGRTPWNKGIKHSEETRMRIKKRTIEALSDPKVRKKMSEWPHSHSDQSKARISSALRKVWQESLKHKMLQEKLYLLWAGYVAEAARRGGKDQRELDWDAFHKISAELNFEYLQEREEKLKAREAANLKAEIVARDRAERLAQRRKIDEEKAKTKALARQNLLERENKKILATDLKLIKRLAKIRCRKKTMVIPVSSRRSSSGESQPSVEKLDLELIKAQKIQRSVSLAEQLQTLKSKKEENASSSENDDVPYNTFSRYFPTRGKNLDTDLKQFHCYNEDLVEKKSSLMSSCGCEIFLYVDGVLNYFKK